MIRMLPKPFVRGSCCGRVFAYLGFIRMQDLVRILGTIVDPGTPE